MAAKAAAFLFIGGAVLLVLEGAFRTSVESVIPGLASLWFWTYLQKKRELLLARLLVD